MPRRVDEAAPASRWQLMPPCATDLAGKSMGTRAESSGSSAGAADSSLVSEGSPRPDRLRILACPAQWFISDMFGSEATWPLRLMQEGHRQFENEYVAFCNGYDVKEPTPGIELRALGRADAEWTIAGMGLLMARYFARGRRILRRGRFDLLHHMFPWGFQVGFNPLSVLGHVDEFPFVVGPIQAPQVYLDYTEYQHRAVLDASQARTQRKLEVGSAPILRQLTSPLQRKSLLAADALAFDGPTTRDLYRSTYPSIADTPTYIIPAGVETDTFSPRIDFSDRPPEIMTAGYFTKRKGLEVLVSALPSVFQAFPEFSLRVCGDGPAIPDAEHMAAELGVRDRITFQGLVRRSELPDYYSRARLYVQPSLSEAYPSALLEALACGTPAVATSVGVVPDHFKGNAAVRLTPPGDSETLATAVVESLGGHGAEMSRTARGIAETELSWHHVATQWQKVYQAVVR